MSKIMDKIMVIIFCIGFIYALLATYNAYIKESWITLIIFGPISLLCVYSIIWEIRNYLNKDD